MAKLFAPDRLRRMAAWGIGLALLYAAFELGRSLAGHSALTAFQQRQALSGRVESLARERAALERRVAAGEIMQQADREAQSDAQAAIGELQAELAQQQQELEFYRGLVTEKFGAGTLKVQELSVRPEGGARYTIVVTLVQTAARDAVDKGALSVALDGSRGGALAQLPMADITPDGRKQLPFSLRYFKTLEIPIELPAGFKPAALQLEYRSDRGGPEPQRQTFPWQAVLAGLQAPALTSGPLRE